jgi:hypothetical protein
MDQQQFHEEGLEGAKLALQGNFARALQLFVELEFWAITQTNAEALVRALLSTSIVYRYAYERGRGRELSLAQAWGLVVQADTLCRHYNIEGAMLAATHAHYMELWRMKGDLVVALNHAQIALGAAEQAELEHLLPVYRHHVGFLQTLNGDKEGLGKMLPTFSVSPQEPRWMLPVSQCQAKMDWAVAYAQFYDYTPSARRSMQEAQTLAARLDAEFQINQLKFQLARIVQQYDVFGQA